MIRRIAIFLAVALGVGLVSPLPAEAARRYYCNLGNNETVSVSRRSYAAACRTELLNMGDFESVRIISARRGCPRTYQCTNGRNTMRVIAEVVLEGGTEAERREFGGVGYTRNVP